MIVRLSTNHGDIELELDQDGAPKTTENFLGYVREGHYNGTVFHRVIEGFMIQGGGFDTSFTQKETRDSIDNEATKAVSNLTGTVAMARTSDPHSASAQFFINTSDNKFLDHSAKTPDGWGYCVFGKVSKGMNVVQSIEGCETGTRSGHRDVPVDDVVISKAQILDA